MGRPLSFEEGKALFVLLILLLFLLFLFLVLAFVFVLFILAVVGGFAALVAVVRLVAFGLGAGRQGQDGAGRKQGHEIASGHLLVFPLIRMDGLELV